MVGTEATTDNAATELAGRAPERDVSLAFAKVAEILAVIELDHDLGMLLVQFTKHRREQSHSEDVLRRDPDRAARVALFGRRGFGEGGGGNFHVPRPIEQIAACGR